VGPRKRAGAQNQSGDLTDVIQSMGYSERLQDSKTPTQAKVLPKLQVKLQAEMQIKSFCMLDGAPGFQGSSGLLASQQHFKPQLCFNPFQPFAPYIK
jgi:hypothetical protein